MGWDAIYCPVCKHFVSDDWGCQHYEDFGEYVDSENFNDFVEFCKKKYGEVRILNEDELEILVQTVYSGYFGCDLSNGYIEFEKPRNEKEVLEKILAPNCSYEQILKDRFEPWFYKDYEYWKYDDEGDYPKTFKEFEDWHENWPKLILSEKLRNIINDIKVYYDDFETFHCRNEFLHN